MVRGRRRRRREREDGGGGGGQRAESKDLILSFKSPSVDSMARTAWASFFLAFPFRSSFGSSWKLTKSLLLPSFHVEAGFLGRRGERIGIGGRRGLKVSRLSNASKGRKECRYTSHEEELCT